MNNLHFSAFLSALVAGLPVHAGEIAAAPKTSATPCEDLWNRAIIYQNKDNPILQEFSLQGRLQLQYAAGSSDQGNFSSGDLQDLGTDTWEDIDVRRWYMGLKATLFHDLKVNGNIVVNPDWGPVYGSLFDLYATWTACDQFQISAGKLEVRFTKEFEISSKEIATFERSLLNNQLAPKQITGAWINGRNVAGAWFYELGVYAADVQEEFTEFQGGAITLGKIGYDLKAATSLEQASVAFQWLHSTDPGDAGAKPYADNFNIAAEIKQGRWGGYADILYATGRNELTGAPVSDVWGFSLTPTFHVTDKLQLVARYQFARSNAPGGLNLQTRYEATAPDLITRSGDQYQAGYLGVNYYLCGHKLKLMTGVEYASMQDDSTNGGGYSGWTWTSGVRMYF
jgi:phosphate-selective porin OprO and OprP